MIYSINDPDEMGPGGVFNGHFGDDLYDPLLWRNFMPDLGRFGEATFTDPNVMAVFDLVQRAPEIRQTILNAPTVEVGFQQVYAEVLLPGGYLAQLGGRNVVSALRGVLGNVAITVGVLRRSRGNLKRSFNDPLVAVANSVDMLSNIVNSEYFQKAVEGIAYWPIIGWIIAIVAEILQTVVKISDYFAAKRLTKVTKDLARRFYLPMHDFGATGQEHETAYMHILLTALQSGAADILFRPAYGAKSADDLEAWPATDSYKHDGEDYRLADAWYVYLRGRSGSGGLGFLPGTARLILMDEFRTAGCGEGNVRNIGDHFVTVRATASYVWNVALQEGNPFCCAIDTRGMADAWADHAYAALVFAVESVSKGWSCDEAPWPSGPISIDTPDQDQAVCHPRRLGAYPGRDNTAGVCSSKGAKPRYGDKMPIPSRADHFDEYVWHITRLYWGRGPEQDSFPLPVRDPSKEWDPDTYHYQNMSSALAIGNMHDRQVAFIDSPDAFYVHPFAFDSSVGRRVVPFPALLDPGLRKRWERNITDFLVAPQIWRNVMLPDVPKIVVIDGEETVNPIYKILKDRGLPEEVHPGLGVGGMQIGIGPGYDVKPPEPPEQAGNSIRVTSVYTIPQGPQGPPPGGPGWTTGKKVLAGAAAAGAVVGLGALAYRRWGRGFIDLGAVRAKLQLR